MSKLRIAACDDEVLDLACMIELIREYDGGNQMHLSTFVRAIDLLDENEKLAYDIVLLDIEMPPPTGFDVAKQLIDLANHPIIIFTTKSNAYALKGYGTALRYLQKPLVRADFFEAMDAAIREVTAHRFSFVLDDATITVPLSDIFYIEMFGHYAVLHDEKREYRFRSTLKEIMSVLPKGYFSMPHKSIVVNLEHVRSATSSEILLDNGDRVPISRRKLQEFNQSFYRFLGR